ncbi:hypothetical protein TNCV_4300591, partial [Trichonephila clavipes]
AGVKAWAAVNLSDQYMGRDFRFMDIGRPVTINAFFQGQLLNS